ncbi:hypothetical protein IMG5_050840, partial [Ichthyophthirius multifiliis]
PQQYPINNNIPLVQYPQVPLVQYSQMPQVQQFPIQQVQQQQLFQPQQQQYQPLQQYIYSQNNIPRIENTNNYDDPVSKPSAGFVENINQSQKIKNQQDYSKLLQYQIDIQNQKKKELQELEKLQQEKIVQERQRQQFFNRGAPQRDLNGNILSSKVRPGNPNYQSMDWFSHMGHKILAEPYQQEINNQLIYKNQSAQDLAVYDKDIKYQKDLEQRVQTGRNKLNQIYELNQENENQNQKTNSHVIELQQQYQGPENNIDLQKMNKRQEAIELQREQLQQIEEKKRQRELKILQEKRERELEDLRIE